MRKVEDEVSLPPISAITCLIAPIKGVALDPEVSHENGEWRAKTRAANKGFISVRNLVALAGARIIFRNIEFI